MTEPLDVYIHTSGVVELRPANIPDHLDELFERVWPTERYNPDTATDPIAPMPKETRWRRVSATKLHGVTIWTQIQ